MKVSFNYTADDRWNFEKYVIRTVPKFRSNFILKILSVLVRAFMGSFFGLHLGLYLAHDIFFYYFSFLEMLVIAILISLPLVCYYIYKHKSRYKKMSKDSEHKGMLTIEIDENGIQESTTITKEFVSWEGVHRIEQDTEYIYLFIDTIRAYVIPKRVFPSKKESEEFYSIALSFYNSNKTNRI